VSGIAALASLAGILAIAGPATANTTLGKNFVPTVTNCGAAATTYYVKSPSQYTVPVDGVITSWTFTTGSEPIVGFRFKVGIQTGLGANDTRTFLTTAAEPAVNLPKNAATTAHVRIPVGGQDSIGFFLVNQGGLIPCSRAVDADAATAPYLLGDPEAGHSDNFTEANGSEYPLSARLEDDADHDGYGDQTQDACPTDATTHGQCPSGLPVTNGGNTTTTSGGTTKDTTRPTIGGLSFSSTVFEAAKSGASIAKKVKVGTKVSLTVSEGSTVKFTVQRKTTGRKVAKTCKAKTKSNAKKKACTRWVAVKGSFSVRAGVGKNTFTFRGRIGGKSLKPGHYRLTGTATDSAKNASLPRNKSFTIVP
jgi:hypothetical protein